MLSSLREEDSDCLFEWINDRDLVRLSAAFHPVSREEHAVWFTSVRERSDTRIFGVRLRGHDRLVGSCQLHKIDEIHRSAELQIRIGDSDSWGLGIGTEATRLLLAFGFETLGLHRIYLSALSTNERALRMYRRLGMKEEGTLREAALIDGTWVDLVAFAILSDEWGTET